MREHFYAARRGGGERLPSKTSALACNRRVQVHHERRLFQLATLKAKGTAQNAGTRNGGQRTRRDVRRACSRA